MHAISQSAGRVYRGSIGFENLLNHFDRIANSDTSAFPPYNIEKRGEYDYRLTLAIAGFTPEEIDIEVQKNQITIRSIKSDEDEGEAPTYLHQGIAKRAFKKQFYLAENVSVEVASIENGLLNIDLKKQVPEEEKPLKIEIRKI